VYNNSDPTVNHQTQQAENPMPDAVISTEAVCLENAILHDYLTSQVALEEPEIGSTDPNIPIDNNCRDDELHFGMPGGSEDYDNEADQIDKRDAIPTASWRRRAATELERFELGTGDGDGYQGEDGDDPDPDEEDKASQADDGLMQTLED
jgi:hypothetical protein